VGPPHGEIRARFVEKDQSSEVYLGDPLAEPLAFGVDAGPVLLRRPAPFFLKT
jgi:hypothetical protein